MINCEKEHENIEIQKELHLTSITRQAHRSNLTLNMGRTCSKCLAEVKGACTWLTDSIKFLAVAEMASISIFHNNFRRFSFDMTENQQYSV